MTINKLIKELKKAKPLDSVRFDFCGCTPTEIACWRGIYAEPALGWAPTGYSGMVGQKTHTASSLIEELERAINGRVYCGWKGGDYYYDGNEPLHVDNDGDYTQTNISHVSVTDYGVIIHTECDD
jgi:hypothetical protein